MSKEKKNNSETKKKVKKVVGGLLAAVLLVGGAILGTLAFLKTMSDTKTNTFTASQDIKLGLDEPNFNEWGFVDDEDDWQKEKDDVNGYNTPRLKYPTEPDPSNYIPNQTYQKDPILYNLTGTDKGSSEWVAIRVDYTIGSSNTEVTYTQLTHSCNRDDIDVYNADPFTKCFRYTDGTNKTVENNCKYKVNSTGTGIIEEIAFDADECTITTNDDTTNRDWSTGHNWIRLTSDQINALLLEEEEEVLDQDFLDASNEDKKYDIFVYKYKLTEKYGIDTIKDAQDDGNFIEAVESPASDDNVGGKTTPLFECIKTKTKEQLALNNYVNNDTLTAPQFQIILKGAAAKHDETVTTTRIIAEDIDDTIVAYVEYNEDSDLNKVAVTETDSYKIVKELVQLLGSAS